MQRPKPEAGEPRPLPGPAVHHSHAYWPEVSRDWCIFTLELPVTVDHILWPCGEVKDAVCVGTVQFMIGRKAKVSV